ncbi:MAG: hypothetical protein MJZ61_04185, partial [Bacteroidales bacterium]|nr:hypothetical protein [Bacteroidales bacterium]
MRKQIIYSSILSAMILSACGGSSTQTQNQQPAADTTQSQAEVEIIEEEAPSAPQNCEHYSALALLLRGHNPIICDSSEYLDKGAKSFEYMLYNGKLIPIKYKEYQEGEHNLGSLIFYPEVFDELSGHVYTLSQKVDEDYGTTVELFSKDLCESHHLAKNNYSKNPKIPEHLRKYISEKYPTLKIDRPCAQVDIDDGKAHYYSLQFKMVADSNLAINVLEMQDKFYVNEVWGHGGVWNVDDDGLYNYPQPTIMAANDGSHFDIFYTTGAAESTSYGELVIEGDKLIDKNIHGYYNYIDYNSKRIPNYWNMKYSWNNFFNKKEEIPNEYATIKAKDYYCLFLRKDETLLYCKFQNGNVTPVCTNIDTVSEALGYI